MWIEENQINNEKGENYPTKTETSSDKDNLEPIQRK
jgi:hypothetical protein